MPDRQLLAMSLAKSPDAASREQLCTTRGAVIRPLAPRLHASVTPTQHSCFHHKHQNTYHAAVQTFAWPKGGRRAGPCTTAFEVHRPMARLQGRPKSALCAPRHTPACWCPAECACGPTPKEGSAASARPPSHPGSRARAAAIRTACSAQREHLARRPLAPCRPVALINHWQATSSAASLDPLAYPCVPRSALWERRARPPTGAPARPQARGSAL